MLERVFNLDSSVKSASWGMRRMLKSSLKIKKKKSLGRTLICGPILLSQFMPNSPVWKQTSLHPLQRHNYTPLKILVLMFKVNGYMVDLRKSKMQNDRGKM